MKKLLGIVVLSLMLKGCGGGYDYGGNIYSPPSDPLILAKIYLNNAGQCKTYSYTNLNTSREIVVGTNKKYSDKIFRGIGSSEAKARERGMKNCKDLGLGKPDNNIAEKPNICNNQKKQKW